MFGKPSLVTRIAVGKIVGLAIGTIGFLSIPYLVPDMPPMIRWGVLLWYTTVGAVIGMVGVWTRHPVLLIPLPWWLRSTIVGAWMNFVLMFFAYDAMAQMLTTMFGDNGIMHSPLWFVAEGAVVGLIIGFLATKLGGEGREAFDGDAAGSN